MALEHVVALGSGRNAYIEGYRVGGKTGTAQKVSDGRYMVGNYITSFIGFMPANDPKIIVYVAIDNPKGITAYGGTVAAPIAKNILMDSINALNIEKQDGGIDKEYQWYETKYYTVPDVVGKSIKDVSKELSSFTIQYTGTGNIIKAISPLPGSKISEGSTVKILLGD